MRRSSFNRFVANENAAIGPLYALGISVFVVMSAVGFDYGRLMALDTELQNAADQAALAAATQLDGSTTAMANARNAANSRFATASSAYVNETRFANDRRFTLATNTRPIVNLSYRFFNSYNSTTDVPGTLLTSDTQSSSAQVVEVTVNARRVFYAMTPLVGLVSSGDVIGRALAGLQNSTCNVPPLMFCLPNTSSGTVNLDFPTAADVGKGLKLHMNANAADPWAPGNFGFLDIPFDVRGNPNRTLGQNNSASGCSDDVVESRTGVRDPESTALNTRFDIYPNGGGFNCDSSTGDFCPSQNTRKDYTFAEVYDIRVRQTDPVPAAPNCGTYDSRTGFTENTAANSLPEDNCFVAGTCAVIGSAAASASTPNWAASAYMAAHHGGASLPSAAPNGTRYEVYKWELGAASTRLATQRLSTSYTTRDRGVNRTYRFTNICAYPQPTIGTGVAASATQKDRRVLTVAAVDCTGLHGSSPVRIIRWVDLFLVKPASSTGADKEFFTEIVGPARKADNSSGFQYFGRNKAVLIR